MSGKLSNKVSDPNFFGTSYDAFPVGINENSGMFVNKVFGKQNGGGEEFGIKINAFKKAISKSKEVDRLFKIYSGNNIGDEEVERGQERESVKSVIKE